MTPSHPLPPSGERPELSESADLFDYAKIRDWTGFVLRAVKRHPRRFAGVALGTLLLALLSLWALPKTFHVESRILAQQNRIMPALGNPGRAVPWDADTPTRAATETVMQRANLVKLIKQTGLEDRWDESRAPLVRAKDAIVRLFAGEATSEDRIDSLVGLLEKKLKVETGEGTVSIEIDWSDAQMAYALVEAAQQNFRESRYKTDVDIIAKAISILEGHAANIHDSIQSSLDELSHVKDSKPVKLAGATTGSTAKKTERTSTDPAVVQIKAMITAKRGIIQDLEAARQRRMVEVQGQLVEARTTYAEGHPAVVGLMQTLSSLKEASPQVLALRQEEEDLEDDLQRRLGPNAPPRDRNKAAADPASDEEAIRLSTEESIRARQEVQNLPNDSGAMEFARDRLRLSLQKYEGLLDRIDSARIELDTARAAFDYRYIVIRPPQVPKEAAKPKPGVMIFGGLIAGLLLALVAAALADLQSGKLVEAWQVERQLGLRLLGRVDQL